MERPDDIPQDAWDAAEKPAFRVQIDVAAGQIWDIRPTIARAIMAAEKRGEERERESCASICKTLGVHGGVDPNPYADWKPHADNLAAAISKRGESEVHEKVPPLTELPDLTKTSVEEMMQELHVTERSHKFDEWSLEQIIEHACSLAISYGAGRDDILEEYRATKEQALRMARDSDEAPLAFKCGTCGEKIRRHRLTGTACGCSPVMVTVGVIGRQTDIEAAVAEFKSKLPGWWYSVGECQVSCDASCAPTVESEHINLIRSAGDPFDAGFHVDLAQPSSLAAALRHVMSQALAEIEKREGRENA